MYIFTLQAFAITEDFETGDLTHLPWSTGGDGSWSVVNSTVYEGTFSVEAPTSINDNQSSYLEVTLDVPDGGISFQYKVLSERDKDYFIFYIDGTEQERWSGNIDWTQASYPTSTGTHTFRWEYSKDNNFFSDGSDTAWIDNILIQETTNQTITFSTLPSKTYGDGAFFLTATASSGLPVIYTSSESITLVDSSQMTVTIVGAGNTTITASQPGNTIYTAATPVDQTLTINKKSLTVQADDITKIGVQGEAIPSVTLSYSGFVNNDDASVIDSLPTISPTAVANSPSGTYQITLSGGSDDNYDLTLVDGNLFLTIDEFGFLIGAISGNTDEAGKTATFTVRLNKEPSENVTLPVSSSNEL